MRFKVVFYLFSYIRIVVYLFLYKPFKLLVSIIFKNLSIYFIRKISHQFLFGCRLRYESPFYNYLKRDSGSYFNPVDNSEEDKLLHTLKGRSLPILLNNSLVHIYNLSFFILVKCFVYCVITHIF